MDEKPAYIFNGKEYLPREEYEKIKERKRQGLNKHFFIGLANSVFVLGIPTAYAGVAHGSEQSLVEVAKNSSLENLVLWGGVFLINFVGATINLYEANKFRKELKYTISEFCF